MRKRLIAWGVLSLLAVLSVSAQRGMRVRQNVPTDSIRLSDPAVLADKKANMSLAMRLRRLFVGSMGYQPYIDSPTNQQFFVIPDEDLQQLRQHIGFEVWCRFDDSRTVCRFVTSWATTEEEINELEKKLA